MPPRIQIIVENQTQFDRVFHRLDEVVGDLSEIWDDVRDYFWEIEADQFQSGGAKGASGAWAPLSPAYERQKTARYGSFALIAGPLIATEAMYKSLTRQTEHTVYLKDKKEMAIGTNLERARFHQNGAGRLPKREVISLSGDQKRSMQKVIQKGLLRNIRRHGVYVETESNTEI